jgi:hypothetical protein
VCAQHCEAAKCSQEQKERQSAHLAANAHKKCNHSGGEAEKDPAHSYGQVRPHTHEVGLTSGCFARGFFQALQIVFAYPHVAMQIVQYRPAGSVFL